ncbi:MAG: hypothetical protein L6R40_006943 [Gallowayella cf. fulva]|nr:MAG: hypothetical protein L6R40_006943 [Xanthomendoza cf. fulva]
MCEELEAVIYLILLSRQGKVRLAKWFTTLSPKDKAKIIKDVSQLVLSRRTRMCNFLEYKDTKVVYRRYASLFFIAGCSSTDNELITLEIVHRYVEQMDKYYGNVCELDIIFNFQKAYFILDELLLAGEMQESSKKNVLRCISQQDSLEDMECSGQLSLYRQITPFNHPGCRRLALPSRLARRLSSGQLENSKYLPLRDFEDVTNALNFDTADSHIIGGCDLYTTKAAGADKKLYKAIEQGLEDQHLSRIAISESLPEPRAGSFDQTIDLSRSSPFGPLSQHTARRTFAYLIATLNASHPDYDFSHLLRPSDFRREKSLRHVMNTLDTTLYSLRPRPTSNASLGIPTYWTTIAASAPAVIASNGESWNPRKWRLIDKEMSLKDCSIYAYVPEEDPYDGDEGAIWSFNYFFFNKVKKRVCYLYLKSLSIISHSDALKTPVKEKRRADIGWGGSEPGSSKRARYWLGDREDVSGVWHDDDDDDDDDDDYVVNAWDRVASYGRKDMFDEGDEPSRITRSRATETISPSLSASSGPSRRSRSRSKSTVRDMNDDIAESIDV